MKQMKVWSECSLEQQVERWENVERVLKELTPHERRKHWNMGEWAEKTDCGTTACAAGHCGFDPWFNRRGFKLKFVKKEYMDNLYDSKTESYKNIKVIKWNLNTGYLDNNIPEYVTDFFGHYGTCNIFYNGSTCAVSEVIKEVKSHIKYLKEHRDE